MNFQDLVAFQDYVRKHFPRFIELVFFGFATADNVTHDPENKGENIIQIGTVDGEIVGPWKALTTADAKQSTGLKPVKLKTVRAQFLEKFIPEELEKNYLGYMRRVGQNVDDFPIYEYMLRLLAGAIRENMEKSMWKAVEVASPTKLSEMFDGFLSQIETAITAGDLTPVSLGTLHVPLHAQDAAPAGSTDIIDAVEALVDALPEAVQEEGVYVYMSAANKRKWERANKRRFGANESDLKRESADQTSMTGDIRVVGLPGMNGSDRMIATPMRNIFYSYDAPNDADTINSEQHLNQFYIFGAFRIGAGFGVLNDEWVKVNELV